MKIGILAVQGDYEAHGNVLARLGIEHTLVRTQADFSGLNALILPGGESTTHLKILTEEGLVDAIRGFAASGGALFGTCAGAILLARDVRSPAQPSLGLLDIVVLRNAYGRQLASDVRVVPCKLRDQPLEMVFIRAPVIDSVGSGVTVLAEYEGHPVLVEQGKVMASTFHPELTSDTFLHQRFLEKARNGS